MGRFRQVPEKTQRGTTGHARHGRGRSASTGDRQRALLPANNAFRATVLDGFFKDGEAMYAQFKQENAIEVTMRSFLLLQPALSAGSKV